MKIQLRRLTGMVALVASVATTVRADYPAAVTSLGPVAYWRLGETVQPPPADVAFNIGSLGDSALGYYLGTAVHPSGGALAGTTETGATYDATANCQTLVPFIPEMHPAPPFTVEAWLNPGVALEGTTLTCPLSAGAFGDPRSGWLIYQGSGGWNLRMYDQKGLATSVNITGGGTPSPGTWYHVVATYDGAMAKLYVNGTKAAEVAQTSYVPGRSGGFAIGARADGSFWWNGSADEVALYPTALSDADIAAHYANGTSTTPSVPYQSLVLAKNPLAYYRLNEGAYTPPTTLPVAVNSGSSGSALDGSYNPGMRAGAAGPQPPLQRGFPAGNVGGGFNGSAGFVGTPLQLNDLTAFSVVGWIRRGAIKSGRGGYFGQNDLFEFGDADNGTNIELWTSARGQIKAPFPFPDDQWGLFAVTGDENNLIVYANGREIGRLTGPITSYGSSSFLFNIGGGGIFNAGGDFFRGNIDEVAVFPSALTAAQVQSLYFAAETAPVISTQPTAPARTLFAGNTLAMSVVAGGAPPLSYAWTKNGTPIGGQTTAALSVPGLVLGETAAYAVVVSNPYGSVTSNPVNITAVAPDAVAPVAQYAAGMESLDKVKVWFSESLDPVTAQNPANYSIPGLAVTAATLSSRAGTPGDNIVILTTAKQTPGQTFALTITGVKDQTEPSYTVASGTTLAFSSWALAQGMIRFEHYDNIPGAADSGITAGLSDPRYIAGTPTTLGVLTGSFDTRSVFPTDVNENYMAKMSGFITPTETGDYYFFVASDDASRVYLSSNEVPPNPATDTPIVYELGCCGSFFEPDSGDTATTATPIRLNAGQRYAILVFLKEGGGGDWLRLAWRNANDATPAASLPPIPAQFLSTYVDPNVDVAFTTQPANQSAVLPGVATSFVTKSFVADDGGFTVVNTETPPPGPFVYDGASGVWYADGAVDGCGGPYNSQLSSPEYTVPVSQSVTLSVQHRYSFEGDRWDGGQIRISRNGGGYTNIPAENFTANGYAPGTIQGSGILNGQRAFNADSPGYTDGTFITTTAILGNFTAGDKISVQFLGGWDDCSTGKTPSWVIKDLQLSYSSAPQNVTFTSAATVKRQGANVPFSYQWQRNDGAGYVDITGATGATYSFFPTVAADLAATFRVVVGVPGKFVPSDEVRVVPPRPTLSVGANGANVVVTFTGKLQSSTSITGPFSDVAGATSPYVAPASGTGNLFFRSAQ